MAQGTRIPLVSGSQFEELEAKVSGDETGLIPRVIALETSSGKGVRKHQTDIQYEAEDIVVKNDFFYEALEANNGPFNATKWKKIGVSRPYDPIVMRQFLLEGGSGDLVARIEGNKLIVEMLNQQVESDPRVQRSFNFDGDTGLFRMENPNYDVEPQDNDVVTLKYLDGVFLRSEFQEHDESYTKNLNDMVGIEGRHRIRTPLTNGPIGFSTTHTLPIAHTYCEWVRSTDSKVYKLQTVIGFSPLITYRRLVEVNSDGSYLISQTPKSWVPDVTKEYVIVNTDNFTWDDTKNRLRQKDVTTEEAKDIRDILTLRDGLILFRPKARLKMPNGIDLDFIVSDGAFWGENTGLVNAPPVDANCDSYTFDVEVLEVDTDSYKIKQVFSTMDRDSATQHVQTWARVGEFTTAPPAAFTNWIEIGGLSGTANRLVSFDANGKPTSSALTSAKAEALQNLADENQTVLVDGDGKLVTAPLSYVGVASDETEHYRWSQTTAPKNVASSETDLMTLKDTNAIYRKKSEYPVGEVFCMGMLQVSVSTSGGTISKYGFKYKNPTVGSASYVGSTNEMDYVTFTISSYKPSGMVLSNIWLEWSHNERDNIGFVWTDINTAGTAGSMRVYSADNSDWAGDNVMGLDDMTLYIKIMAVASA